MREIYYTRHTRASSLIKQYQFVSLNDVVDVSSLNIINAKYMAQSGAVFHFAGNDYQNIPIPGGEALIFPCEYIRGDQHRKIGGNVVFIKYVDEEGDLFEEVYHSDELLDWMNGSDYTKAMAIRDPLLRFMFLTQYPFIKNQRAFKKFEVILNVVNKYCLVESAMYDTDY